MPPNTEPPPWPAAPPPPEEEFPPWPPAAPVMGGTPEMVTVLPVMSPPAPPFAEAESENPPAPPVERPPTNEPPPWPAAPPPPEEEFPPWPPAAPVRVEAPEMVTVRPVMSTPSPPSSEVEEAPPAVPEETPPNNEPPPGFAAAPPPAAHVGLEEIKKTEAIKVATGLFLNFMELCSNRSAPDAKSWMSRCVGTDGITQP